MTALNRALISMIGAMAVLAGTVTAQPVVVAGTGDPNLDVPAVQAAVDRGGRVLLKGHFSFDAPPTVAETPSLLFTGAASGMVLVSRAVAISGARDDQGEMTTIEGGTNPFYVNAPGARVSIQGLHFIHSNAVAIRVVAASGLLIAYNRIDGVRPKSNIICAIILTTATGDVPPAASDLGQSANVSGTLLITNNDIDLQGTVGGNFLGIVVLAVGKSPDKEANLYVLGNNIRNTTERPINMYAVGGRASVERNVITTGAIGVDVAPSGDVIHIVGPGSFLIARNTIDCAWTSGAHAGIRLQSRPDQPVSDAIVVDNDVNMATPDGAKFDVTSAAIEVRGGGEGNKVLNNRIRGRANFALSVAAQNGTPQGTSFIMNDLQGFTAAQAGLFVDAGGSNTVLVGGPSTVDDHGSGTVIVPTR